MSDLAGVYDTVAVWVVHRIRSDDGTCDGCGDSREVGYLRWEAPRIWHYLLPECGRYCHDCMADRLSETADDGRDA